MARAVYCTDNAGSGAFDVDADHINLTSVDRFITASDFYTVDVADYSGKPANETIISQNVTDHLFCRHLQPIFGS